MFVVRLIFYSLNRKKKMERTKSFKIGEHSFTAKFPNVGQLIDLESYKQSLTNGRYGQMAASGIRSQYYALDLIDAIVFFQVVVPEVGKYFDISNYASISLEKAKPLIEVYQTEIRPWFESTMNELKGIAANGNEKEE